MIRKPNRYDKCSAYQCANRITHAIVYGCLNGHLQHTFCCLSHMTLYRDCIPGYHCGICGMRWEDSLTEELWVTPATTR